MRIFQTTTFYPEYLKRFHASSTSSPNSRFSDLQRQILEDRFDATHILEPIYSGSADVAFAIANDRPSQELWAREQGLKTVDLKQILRAQIEHHRAEVVYNQDPITLDSAFMRSLPGSVKTKVCWRAAPIENKSFEGFDLCLGNYIPFLEQWAKAGRRTAYFTPSHDPAMSAFARNEDRPIDICFIGSYSPLHSKRNEFINAFARLAKDYNVVLGLLHSRFKPWTNIRGLRRIPSPFPMVPREVRKLSIGPVFGRKMYELLSRSKVVLNLAIDMAGQYRGNMRCFEAMGCGACMLSDQGIYPEGMIEDVNFVGYRSVEDALDKAKAILNSSDGGRQIGREAASLIESTYSKRRQWAHFQELVAL